MASQITYWSLGVEDPQRAKAFYGPLFGWTFSEPGSAGGVHVLESDPWGGLSPATRRCHTAFSVPDADAAIAKVTELGGSVTSDSDDGYGRWIECTDDQGTVFAIFNRPADS